MAREQALEHHDASIDHDTGTRSVGERRHGFGKSTHSMNVRRTFGVLAFALLTTRTGISAASSPVVVDLVVRDRRGDPLADIRAEEVHLYEDGVEQVIRDFRRVTLRPASSGVVPGAATQAETDRRVIFLFPRLQGVERDLALSGADEFLKKQFVPGMSVAVFLVGPELEPVQDFTTDVAALKDAVRRALAAGDRSRAADVRVVFSLVQRLKDQAGRKTVLLFSSSLGVPSGFEDSALDVAGLANRCRISFYGVDPRGRELSSGATRIDQPSQGSDLSLPPAWSEFVKPGVEHPGDVDLRSGGIPRFSVGDPSRKTLARLAQGTGGFVVERANSLSNGMRQIAEDVSGYYEVAYTPAAPKSDGQLRGLDVKITRDGARAQTRQQYFVGEVPASLVPAFERRLVEALAADPLPSDVEVWDRALHFGWDGQELTHVLWVMIPLEKVSLATVPAASTAPGRFEGDVSILARVKDASGGIVATFSQRVPLVGSLEELGQARTQAIQFTRRVKLVPGAYTFEIAVQDRGGHKLTVRRTPFEAQTPQGIALSSLSLGDLQPAGASSDGDDPLRLDKQRVIPNLDRPIKAGHAPMTLHLVAYPSTKSKEPAQIAITLLAGGESVNRATATLPRPMLADGFLTPRPSRSTCSLRVPTGSTWRSRRARAGPRRPCPSP